MLLKHSGQTNYWMVVAIGAAKGHAFVRRPPSRVKRANCSRAWLPSTRNEHSEEEICWAAQDGLDAVDELGADALAECATLRTAYL